VSKRMRFTLRAAVSVVLIGALLWKLRQQGGAGVTLVSGWWLVAAACLIPIAVLLRVASFNLLINRDERLLTFGETLHLTLVGAGASMFLPGGGGDLLKASLGARTYGSPEQFVAATVVDKLTSLLALGALGLAGALLSGQPGFGLLSGAALLVACAPIVVPSVVPWKLVVRVLAGSDADPETLRRAVRTPVRILAPVLAISALGWAVTFTVILACCRAAGAQVDTPMIYAMSPLVSLSSLVPVSLAGLGLTQVTMTVLLTRAGATGAQAIGASFFQLLVNLGPGLLGIAVYALGGGARRR